MSNGELSPHKNPWARVRLDPTTIMSAVAVETTAVEDAQGDVIGAKEKLRQEVIAAQMTIRSAQDRLSGRQQDVAEVLREMGLMDRLVDFTEGTSLAIIYSRVPGKDIAKLKEENLAGVSGPIVGFEVGTLLGRPIGRADAVVLHVDTRESTTIQADSVAVAADQAEYTISEAPLPEGQ